MVRVGVVGCGYWGPNLVRNLYHLDGCDLVRICDADPSPLAKVAGIYPTVPTTTSFQDLLADNSTDAVVIATPARTHHAMARLALQSGKHVLVEKPLSVTSQQCQDLISLADRQGLVLMVGHTFLYNPALLMVKDLSRRDYLGDLFYLYSHRVNLGRVQTDVNALWSIAPHDISIALFLVGQVPHTVSAQGAYYLSSRIEDVVFITLTFAGGVMAHIHVSWIDPSKTRKVTVVGSEKMIVYDDLADEGKVRVYDKGVKKQFNGGSPGYGEFQYRLHSGDVHLPHIRMTEPLSNECRHFIDCIRTNQQPLSDGRNGLEVVQVLEAAQRSLELQGMPLPVFTGQLQPSTVP